MFRVCAFRVVALMADMHSFWDRPTMQLIGKAVGLNKTLPAATSA